MGINHPWIDEGLDDGEMEAVLVAPNTLPPWEPGQIIRAFQTHQWSNASTDGERTCFSHEETGTIVCHDGSVLGIECGHGDLEEALPDLIAVLFDLGWQGAYVFCLAAHMNGVMTDLGRSIPAHLNFDVQEAARGTRVSEMPEAQSLLDHGRGVLREAEGAVETAAIFNSLVEELPDTDQTPNSRHGAISLQDDDGLDEGNDVPVAAMVAFPSSVKPGPSTRDDDDGAPRVFSFQDEVPAAVIVPDKVPTNQPLRSPVVEPAGISEQPDADVGGSLDAQLIEAQRTLQISQSVLEQWRQRAENHYSLLMEKEMIISELESELKRVIAAGKEDLSAEAVQVPSSEELTEEHAMQIDGVVHVGKSAFYFGSANGQVDLDDVQAIANAFEVPIVTKQIVHLWPGELRQAVRWDVLGEIDQEYPLFANTFAQWAFPGFAGYNMAGVILNKKKHVPFASLRELVNFTEKFDHPLAALSLTAEGDAFVDLRKTADDLADDMHDMFTVREVLLSTTSRLFVVHVDSLDGPFVQWIVELLRKVATGYASSVRYEKVRTLNDVPETEVATPQPDGLKQEVAAMVGEFMQRLQALGVTVP